MESNVFYEICINDEEYKVKSYIDQALEEAEAEYELLDDKLKENLLTISQMTPECDKLDYALAASSGALCGIIDIFLVGEPKNSPLGNKTDEWFADRTKDFAKVCGWDGSKDDSLSKAIEFLEKKFKVPYDQTNFGEAAKQAFKMGTGNHHFLSLAHNPSLIGLFFSILDQFDGTAHFVVGGELITLEYAGKGFVLRGHNKVSKLFCATINWLGHLISDQSGSSGSKGRGMGIPSPLWTWCNDIIAIKRSLHIEPTEFEKSFNNLAEELFVKGYDARFQVTQAIPVFINELITRFMYSTRRMIRYLKNTPQDERNFASLWSSCEPFSNSTVKRMITVAHATFLVFDSTDAVIKALKDGKFNTTKFFLRFNIIGAGKFAFSLYGEGERIIIKRIAINEARFIEKEKIISQYYIDGLKILSEVYDDANLMTFTNDLEEGLCEKAFEKTVELADKRNVPGDKVLRNKSDIDNYFRGNK